MGATLAVDNPFSSLRYSRDVLAPIVVYLFAFLVPFSWFGFAYLSLGMGHFLLAFVYQMYSKKINKIRYFFVAAILLGIAVVYTLYIGNIILLFNITSVLTVFHIGADEFFLRGETLSGKKWITYLGFVLFFSAFFVSTTIHAINSVWVFLAGAFFVLCVLRFFLRRESVSLSEKFLMLECLLLFLLSFVASPFQAFGALVLLHYYAWYTYYAEKVEGDALQKKRYWTNVLWAVPISIIGFSLFYFYDFYFLSFFFLPYYYYMWAAAHVILSIRLQRSPVVKA